MVRCRVGIGYFLFFALGDGRWALGDFFFAAAFFAGAFFADAFFAGAFFAAAFAPCFAGVDFFAADAFLAGVFAGARFGATASAFSFASGCMPSPIADDSINTTSDHRM